MGLAPAHWKEALAPLRLTACTTAGLLLIVSAAPNGGVGEGDSQSVNVSGDSARCVELFARTLPAAQCISQSSVALSFQSGGGIDCAFHRASYRGADPNSTNHKSEQQAEAFLALAAAPAASSFGLTAPSFYQPSPSVAAPAATNDGGTPRNQAKTACSITTATGVCRVLLA